MVLTYKKIPESDKKQLFDLIDVVLNGLPTENYFVPYEPWEYDSMFDEVNYAYLYGAYDGNKLVGMMQLYVSSDMVADLKTELELTEYKVCELGGALVLPEYRSRGIAINLGLALGEEAKKAGFDYIVAAAHPDNRSSWATIARELDFVKETTLLNGSVRKLYMKKIKEFVNQ